ncbi:Hypothetical protein CINCED_3A024747, partial [Cinara cedri]
DVDRIYNSTLDSNTRGKNKTTPRKCKGFKTCIRSPYTSQCSTDIKDCENKRIPKLHEARTKLKKSLCKFRVVIAAALRNLLIDTHKPCSKNIQAINCCADMLQIVDCSMLKTANPCVTIDELVEMNKHRLLLQKNFDERIRVHCKPEKSENCILKYLACFCCFGNSNFQRR